MSRRRRLRMRMRRPDDPVERARASLSGRLEELLKKKPQDDFRLRDLFLALAGRGHAALLVVLAMPFCLPLPLFGLSTIFGLVLAFIGLRIAFGQRPWLPRWMLNKPLRRQTVVGLAARAGRLEQRIRRLLRPRAIWICRTPALHRAHGIAVVVLSLLLALPLPIPASNIIAAVPILFIGLALLEDDGWFLVFSHGLALIAVGAFAALIWASGMGVDHIFERIRAWTPGAE